MVVFTRDGIRHETKEEALQHLEELYITSVPDTESKLLKYLHSYDWKKYNFQASIVGEGEDASLYVEVTDNIVKNGELVVVNQLTVNGLYTNKEPKDVADTIYSHISLLNVAVHEMRQTLTGMVENDKYAYDNPEPVIYLNTNLTEKDGVVSMSYKIDNKIIGRIPDLVNNKVDLIEILTTDVKLRFLKEVQGKFNIENSTIGGIPLDYIIDRAIDTNSELYVKLVEKGSTASN